MMAPATNFDGGGVDEVDLGRAKLTAATAHDGGGSSGGRRAGRSGGGLLHGAGTMGSTREVDEMGKMREGAPAMLK